ncbi:MAG TPA: hypothetical protein VFA07_01220 [Chthonomonadaceae bacterium]|nr:hypothetical protein [Chthonomonadaceae bacterium]
MRGTTDQKAITIRLPADVYAEAQDAARRHETSLNRFVLEAVSQRLKQEEFQELYDAFTLVGQEEDNNVDYAFEAQAEVVLRND